MVDVVECSVQIARVTTGKVQDTKLKYPAAHNSGTAGVKARAKTLAKSEQVAIAEKAAVARWE